MNGRGKSLHPETLKATLYLTESYDKLLISEHIYLIYTCRAVIEDWMKRRDTRLLLSLVTRGETERRKKGRKIQN